MERERYENCMVEWYWSPAVGSMATFHPTFIVFFGDGNQEHHEGGSAEIASLFNRMGADGWRITTAITAANWVTWTLERRGT